MRMLTVPWILCMWAADSLAENTPPAIHTEPHYEVYFKAGETQKLPCAASGEPAPRYYWKRNGLLFNPSGNDDRLVMLPDNGTIIFTVPEDRDQGEFQCFAENILGTSVSKVVRFIQAKMDDFIDEAPKYITCSLGAPCTLPCPVPEVVPFSSNYVHWALKDPSSGRIRPLSYDDRVLMDQDFRLRFTHIMASDHQNGQPYICIVGNPILRRYKYGPLNYITPTGTTEMASPLGYMYASPSDLIGMEGETFSLMCIFSGNPGPSNISWSRTDNVSIVFDNRVQVASFGHELEIWELRPEDEGTYECCADDVMGTSIMCRTFDLRVHSKPYFTQKPENVEAVVGTDAEFSCEVKGVPEPLIHWYINGVFLQDVTDPRITGGRFTQPTPNKVILSNVSTTDSMVLQCNATNSHGYAFADFYLNVIDVASQVIVG